MQGLLALLRPPETEEDARRTLQAFAVVRGLAGRYAHVIGTFEAPILRALKQPEQAKRSLTDALVKNPRMTGAYKDLGDLYATVPDFNRAWLCWLRAREIAPTHAVLRDLAARETWLEAEQPEYFRRNPEQPVART